MARDDDPDSEADEEPEERPPRRTHRSRSSRSHTSRPVRRWDSDEDDAEIDGAEMPPAPRRWLRREDHPVYWRARDSLYFEPLVAVAIVALLIVGLYAYTQNWPPIYVVESSSMQHGDSDMLGLINAGDLVLAKRIPTDQITPYVLGISSGYSTYGAYGDVLLYYPNGQTSATPIIHRAILYLQWDPAHAAYNATDLSGLPCGYAAHPVYNTSVPAACADLTDLRGTLTLYNIGWRSATVCLDLVPSQLGAHSGFITMGDNNLIGNSSSCTSSNGWVGDPDQNFGLSTIVDPGWIIGVARGMLPWFGALKLALEGNTQYVPIQSWEFLALTVVGVILLAFGIHYALRAEGVEDPRRKAEEDAGDEDEEEVRAEPRRRFLGGLRVWHRDPEEEEDVPPTVHRSRPKPSKSSSAKPSGRPAPRVKRSKSSRARKHEDEDDL